MDGSQKIKQVSGLFAALPLAGGQSIGIQVSIPLHGTPYWLGVMEMLFPKPVVLANEHQLLVSALFPYFTIIKHNNRIRIHRGKTTGKGAFIYPMLFHLSD